MTKHKIVISMTMEFELEGYDDSEINGVACEYYKNHIDEGEWYFESIKNLDTNKEV